jgi:regulator of protease activity HflC (stomatin/prohibitin superfamily)
VNIEGLLAAISALAWVLVLGLIGLVVARAARNNPLKRGGFFITVAVVIALLMGTLSAGLVFIEPNERGVVISALPGSGGVRSEPLQPGLNWIIPFAERVVTYSISRQTYTMSIAAEEGNIQGDDSVEARTADGQVVHVDASVIFAIDPTSVVQLHIDWQNTYEVGLVRSLARGVIRDAVSQYEVQAVYSTSREAMVEQIFNELSLVYGREGITLVDFILRNIAFSSEYAASVEAKQVAEQQSQQAFFVVEQRRQEAEQARQLAQGLADAVVIAAQGDAEALIIATQAEAEARVIEAIAEAEALRLLGDALAENPDILTLQYIEKIAPTVRTILLPSDNPFLFNLPGLDGNTSVGP